jgi:hypothetical protein
VLRTRAPVAGSIATPLPLDLHVLSLPLAFILSQDQTLHCKSNLIWIIHNPGMSVQGLACNYEHKYHYSLLQMYTPYSELSATFFGFNFFKELFSLPKE